MAPGKVEALAHLMQGDAHAPVRSASSMHDGVVGRCLSRAPTWAAQVLAFYELKLQELKDLVEGLKASASEAEDAGVSPTFRNAPLLQ